MGKTVMKAAYIEGTGPPDVIQYGELPVPELSGAQVLVKVGAVSLNPVDTYIRGGANFWELPMPFVVGCDLAGNIGPPLVAMKARFPDKAKLRAQIWDSTKSNQNSIMPPFGRHKILSEKEIDQIVEFIYTL